MAKSLIIWNLWRGLISPVTVSVELLTLWSSRKSKITERPVQPADSQVTVFSNQSYKSIKNTSLLASKAQGPLLIRTPKLVD
jgi:hypothetical protein